MRKIASTRRALKPSELKLTGLNPQTVGAINTLAQIVLKARGGSMPKGTTEAAPAMEFLTKALPNLLIDAIMIRRTNVANFNETVLNKRLEVRNAPQNLPVEVILPGTYTGTTSTDPQEQLNFSRMMQSQLPGEIHLVFDIGTETGIEFSQLRDLLVTNENALVKAAEPEVGQQLKATIASLKRATLKLPNLAIIRKREREVMRYNDLIAVIDFNIEPTGTYVPKSQFSAFFKELQSHYQNQSTIPEETPNAPRNFKLEDLRNRTVSMIGAPPRGWSTDRFMSTLKPYGTKVTPDLDYASTYAFYDPKTAPPDKMEEAKRRGIKMIPYASIVPMIMTKMTR